MELGEHIYQLRSARGMSQSDLADALEVSRQSISKWETGGSVPELDKLMKISELFGITLDELVTGEKPEVPAEQTAPVQPEPERPVRSRGQKIAALVLLCFGVLVFLLFLLEGAGVAGLLFALPFLACALVCVVARRRAGLWCAWAVAISVDIYLFYATGIRWQMIFRTLQWEPQWNYMRLAFAWGMFAELVLLVLVTVLCHRKEPLERTRKTRILLAACAAALAALHLPIWRWVLYELSPVLQWTRVMLLTAVLTILVRLRAAEK